MVWCCPRFGSLVGRSQRQCVAAGRKSAARAGSGRAARVEQTARTEPFTKVKPAAPRAEPVIIAPQKVEIVFPT